MKRGIGLGFGVLALSACGAGDTREEVGSPSEYALQCEAALGRVPGFDCTTGVRVPVTVDGLEVEEDQPDGTCDAPSIAEGDCNVGTRVGRLDGETLDGEPRDDVAWAFLCRKYDGIVQLIGTNTETGATCFFESNWDVAEYSELLTMKQGVIEGPIPSPTDAGAMGLWKPSAQVASQGCWNCHLADPFVHTPYVDGARLPSDPTQPVIPNVAGPNSPYSLVGEKFQAGLANGQGLQTLHIADNGCLACHRFSDPRRFGFDDGPTYDANAFMPPDDPGSLTADFEALLKCADQGPESTPGCEWRAAPGD